MDTINVELFRWMQEVKAKNNGKTYLMIGQVKGIDNTLLVTLKNGNGGAVMFCTKHDHVYPIQGRCAECQNAPREEPIEASATACSSYFF